MIDFQTPMGRAIDIFIIALNLLAVALFVLRFLRFISQDHLLFGIISQGMVMSPGW